MAQVFTPDYGLLKDMPQPNPIGSGLGAYQAMQQSALMKQEAQKQQILNQVGQVQLQQARENYFTNRLANLYQMPSNQQEDEYQQIRKDAISVGANPDNLPTNFDDSVKSKAQQAYIAQTKNSKYFLQQMKSATTLQAAQIKAAGMQAGKETEFQKKDQDLLAKDMGTISQNANSALNHVIPITNRALDALNKTSLTGPLGAINWSTPAGQELQRQLSNLQLDKVKDFHLGRMTQYEFNLIMKAVAGKKMYKSELQKALNDLASDSNTQIKQHQFYTNYIKQGGRSGSEASQGWIQQQLPSTYSGTAQSLISKKSSMTKDQWIPAALKLNPGMSIDQVTQEWNKRYGGQ